MGHVNVAPSPNPYRLGFHLVDGGAAMAVYAPYAAGVELCLFDGSRETRIDLPYRTAGIWHGLIPGVAAGQRYGLRAHGDWDPDEGHRFNPHKLLLDPYARGIEGEVASEAHGGFEPLLSRNDDADSAHLVPRGVVMPAPDTSWMTPKPRVPWEDTIIYEAHVRGLTKNLPGVPKDLRGTYAALGHESTIAMLTELGVTSLELLPIHAFADEPHLEREGLRNYWGYSTLGFFAPHAAYASPKARKRGPQAVLDELRGAVDLLHRAGIEVILDVVYNHTCEGASEGRHLSWRGLANRSYYRHLPGEPGTLDDTTGTGNTLDAGEPRVVQMMMDSLRYWAEVVGVDGFRFDLAATLGRSYDGFDTHHPFLVGITTDPVLKSVKLIAEPWDTGLGGWQTGNFPEPMAEWNDRFRDSLRTFWLIEPARAKSRKLTGGVRDLATRLAGSSDVFGQGHPPLSRGPIASVNFITSHDGFTLRDLTEYNAKHNEANGESNHDGTDNNLSYNHGVEGPSDDAAVQEARRLAMRNLLGSLVLAAGVPMITAGDEFGRTQAGNNNAYCQDNPLSWIDWDLAGWQHDLRATTRYLVGLRKAHPVLRPDTFYEGRDAHEDRRDDLAWFRGDGTPATEQWWHDSSKRVLQMMRSLTEGADALVIINGFADPATVTIPADGGPDWALAWDSVWHHPEGDVAREALAAAPVKPGTRVRLLGPSLQLYLSV